MRSALYIVSTPIGNLNDMSDRGKQVLADVNLIAAEDTRHSKRLLNHFGITTPMVAYHEYSDEKHAEILMDRVVGGESIALISDAGTPLVSDPGFTLVKKAHEKGVGVVPVPGACAFVAALTVSGLPSDRFSFEGFLPAKESGRRSCLERLKEASQTQIFYEAPHRIVASIRTMLEVYGPERQAVLARELTKTFETVKKLPLKALYNWVVSDANQQKGEIVVVVDGLKKVKVEVLSESCMSLAALLAEELPPKKASNIVAAHFNCSKKSVYDYILDLKAGR